MGRKEEGREEGSDSEGHQHTSVHGDAQHSALPSQLYRPTMYQNPPMPAHTHHASTQAHQPKTHPTRNALNTQKCTKMHTTSKGNITPIPEVAIGPANDPG